MFLFCLGCLLVVLFVGVVGGVVGVFVVVDELSYPLHGVVEHGPSLVWMVC